MRTVFFSRVNSEDFDASRGVRDGERVLVERLVSRGAGVAPTGARERVSGVFVDGSRVPGGNDGTGRCVEALDAAADVAGGDEDVFAVRGNL